MASHDPQLSRHGNGLGRQLGCIVFIASKRRALEIRKQLFEFLFAEPERRQVDLFAREGSEFDLEQILIPAGVLGNLVVGECIGFGVRVPTDGR